MAYISVRQNHLNSLDGNTSGVAWQAVVPAWTMPPQDKAAFRAKLGAHRSRPNPKPHPHVSAPDPQRSYAWRVAFEPDPEPRLPHLKFDKAVRVHAAAAAAPERPTLIPLPPRWCGPLPRRAFTTPPAATTNSTSAVAEPERRLRKRVAILFGLAYLLLMALTTGLALHGYYLNAPTRNDDDEADDDAETPPKGNLRGSGNFLSGPGDEFTPRLAQRLPTPTSRP
ncbi:hypothetical protein [Glycomyces buryatensis]|uniref:Uncharacterized protein n=1 Tax=Glycomyces buryatensis TaxID=2570927 RepID=A0A4S8QKB2_9ACTN|nr:hypothetical protein [Glycomyces buryatensis]THV41869.1 hypothetical protein FAB82_09110 [Glycomyces buryatensis]